MLIDDDLLMVGSANCDNRSMRLNFELNVLAHCRAEARVLEAIFEEDFAASQEIVIEEFAPSFLSPPPPRSGECGRWLRWCEDAALRPAGAPVSVGGFHRFTTGSSETFARGTWRCARTMRVSNTVTATMLAIPSPARGFRVDGHPGPRRRAASADGPEVAENEIARQHSDDRGDQVMPRFDRSHSIQIIAGTESNREHAEQAGDLPAVPGDRFIQKVKALAAAQPFRDMRASGQPSDEKAGRRRERRASMHREQTGRRSEISRRRWSAACRECKASPRPHKTRHTRRPSRPISASKPPLAQASEQWQKARRDRERQQREREGDPLTIFLAEHGVTESVCKQDRISPVEMREKSGERRRRSSASVQSREPPARGQTIFFGHAATQQSPFRFARKGGIAIA